MTYTLEPNSYVNVAIAAAKFILEKKKIIMK